MYVYEFINASTLSCEMSRAHLNECVHFRVTKVSI